jgi:hypothetical protein
MRPAAGRIRSPKTSGRRSRLIGGVVASMQEPTVPRTDGYPRRGGFCHQYPVTLSDTRMDLPASRTSLLRCQTWKSSARRNLVPFLRLAHHSRPLAAFRSRAKHEAVDDRGGRPHHSPPATGPSVGPGRPRSTRTLPALGPLTDAYQGCRSLDTVGQAMPRCMVLIGAARDPYRFPILTPQSMIWPTIFVPN